MCDGGDGGGGGGGGDSDDADDNDDDDDADHLSFKSKLHCFFVSAMASHMKNVLRMHHLQQHFHSIFKPNPFVFVARAQRPISHV
jgi:hypothetical protein